MANEEHLAILKQGVEAWNQWRKENPDVQPDLSQAKLSNANLDKAALFQADLRQAYLGEADLGWVDLYEAYLVGTHLTRADLTEASLLQANLRRTHLEEANLGRAYLGGALCQHRIKMGSFGILMIRFRAFFGRPPTKLERTSLVGPYDASDKRTVYGYTYYAAHM